MAAVTANVIVRVVMGLLLVSRCNCHPCPNAAHHQYTNDLLALDSCKRATLIRLPPYANSIVSQLDWRQWQASLTRHPDKAFADFVVEGIKDGFRDGYARTSANCNKASKSMRSGKEQRTVIDAYLANECAEGRILGPFDERAMPQLQLSCLGVVPKHTPGS